MSTEDTDPAVVAAGAINAEMTVSLLRGEIKLMADIIREEYAQRDKAWAELLEKCKDQLECFEFFLRSDGLPKRHKEVKELLADIATLMEGT